MRTHRTLLFLLLLTAITHTCVAQGYVNLTKPKAKKMFTKYVGEEGRESQIQESDTMLLLLARAPDTQNLDILLHFDQDGKCDTEIETFTCDSCYQRYLKNVLSFSNYKRKKFDDSTYISNSYYRLILTTKIEKPFSFMTQRSELTRSQYFKLMHILNEKSKQKNGTRSIDSTLLQN